MIKDGEDWHGLQTMNLKTLGYTFQDAQSLTHPDRYISLQIIVEIFVLYQDYAS